MPLGISGGYPPAVPYPYPLALTGDAVMALAWLADGKARQVSLDDPAGLQIGIGDLPECHGITRFDVLFSCF
jgi:hypothetical protein